MAGSFLSALGGLRAHQSWIDVIGNNLANSSTPGFKSGRALFSDLLNVTLRPGTLPSGTLGGTNPLQRGLGVQLATVDKSFEQGALNTTGRPFDLALQGRGFFAVTNGSQTFYSRVGSFGLDAEGNMVDLRSGFRALDASGQPFTVDTSAVRPPSVTTRVGFSGNLPAEVEGPLAQELESSSAFVEGTVAAMTGTAAGPFVVPTGETWTMEIAVDGGALQEVSIPAGSYSAQAIADEIAAQVEGVVVTAASGVVSLASERTGLASSVQVNEGDTGSDLKSLIGLADFAQGTESPASLASELNDLVSNEVDYQTGDVIRLTGTASDGTPVVGSFTYGTDGTTLGDLIDFLGASFDDATVTFDADTGRIGVQADATGESELSLLLTDATNASGGTDWASHFFTVATNGTGPDRVTSSIEVFDSVGTAHVLTLAFERQDDGTWNLDGSVPDAEGSVVSSTIGGIRFGADGSLLSPSSTDLQVQFGSLGTQTIALELGTSGAFDGLTQFGTPASAVADFQDGFGPGELVNMEVTSEGTVLGFFSNGETQELGSFGVATFTNEAGLEDVGGSYLRVSANSGTRVLGAGLVGASGEVIGGALESSNVDTATEFVHLIEAQRGFQANARVITVQDELLNEVVNVV